MRDTLRPQRGYAGQLWVCWTAFHSILASIYRSPSWERQCRESEHSIPLFPPLQTPRPPTRSTLLGGQKVRIHPMRRMELLKVLVNGLESQKHNWFSAKRCSYAGYNKPTPALMQEWLHMAGGHKKVEYCSGSHLKESGFRSIDL